MRIALFGLSLVAVYLLGARNLLAVALAALISMGLSFVLLAGMRDDVVSTLQRRQARRSPGVDEAAEDSVHG